MNVERHPDARKPRGALDSPEEMRLKQRDCVLEIKETGLGSREDSLVNDRT